MKLYEITKVELLLSADWKSVAPSIAEYSIVSKAENWTSPSEEEEEEEERKTFLAIWWLSVLIGTFVMLFSATGCAVHHENTWRWKVGCYNGL